MSHHGDADCHFAAAGVAAVINFPLWKASAIAQSGFKIDAPNALIRYYKAVVRPPFRGIYATILGMTWARAAIFYGSDFFRDKLLELGASDSLGIVLPPLVIGTVVQFANMPLVRATITIQDPNSPLRNSWEAVVHIWKRSGFFGLWHGVSAGVLKTVPKYITAVGVKDFMEDRLPKVEHGDKNGQLIRSGIKSVSAGVAGAVLTNPLDVLRNEMFKTDLSLVNTFRKLVREEGWRFILRGMTSNTTAVAIPIAVTIFMTDVLVSVKHGTYNK